MNIGRKKKKNIIQILSFFKYQKTPNKGVFVLTLVHSLLVMNNRNLLALQQIKKYGIDIPQKYIFSLKTIIGRCGVVAIALAVTPSALATPKFYNGVVLGISDGDTIQANFGGKKTTIRLACIDAPEKKQLGGEESTDKLKQLLPIGQNIKLRLVNRDRYKRLIGEIYLNNQSVNLQMVTEGQAVVYRQYLSGCFDTKDSFLDAESKAKNQRLGFWSQSNPIMPWEFRKMNKRK